MVGKALFDLAAGKKLPDELRELAFDPPRDDCADDHPMLVRDGSSAIAISVTGTNGKTTTTRLIAHLMRTAGFRTGWKSSSGIYVEGEVIEDGDYSGPSGARRVLEDPSLGAAFRNGSRRHPPSGTRLRAQ